jgi:hypothetical protein
MAPPPDDHASALKNRQVSMSGGIADLPSGVLLIVGICRRRVVGAVVIGSRTGRRGGIHGGFNRIGVAAAGRKHCCQEQDDKKPGGCHYSIHKKDFEDSPKNYANSILLYILQEGPGRTTKTPIKELYSKFKQ